MHRNILLAIVAGLSMATFSGRADDPNSHNSGDEASKQVRAPAPSGELNFHTDLFTGRFGYAVPIQVAPARNGSEPQIALRHSSGGENTWCGYGWDLDLGYIQREIKKGVPVRWTNSYPVKEYDDSKGFIFSLGGQSAALVKTGQNEYRAEIDSAFLRFNLVTNNGGSSANYWLVTDKSGHRYFFGDGSNSRMANPKAGWPSNEVRGTFRWALSRVETATGDTTAITYTNIASMLYPLVLAYNGHTSGLTNSHFLRFQLEDRSDKRITFTSGYRVDMTKRLVGITNTVSGQQAHRYLLTYANSPSTLRSLLRSVTVYGKNNSASLPPISFTYTVQPFQFESAVNWTNLYLPENRAAWQAPVAIDSGRLYADLVDMDGDGLPDRVLQTAALIDPPYTNFWVQRNNGSGFNARTSWGPFFSQAQSNELIWTAINSGVTRFLDINGDGFPDRVMDPAETYYPLQADKYSNLVVEVNTGTGFAADVNWSNVRPYALSGLGQLPLFCAIENVMFVKMIDMNGDGLPDRVMRGWQTYNTTPYTNLYVQFNTGNGFTGTNVFGPYYSQNQGTNTWPDAAIWWSVESSYVRFIDINGDGLPDRVMPRYATYMGGYDYFQDFTNFVVEFNNGYGFEPQETWGGVDPQYHQQGQCGDQYTDQYCSVLDSEVVALRDINGDALPDRIMRQFCDPYTNWLVQINTGSGFAPMVNFGPYYSQGNYGLSDCSAIESPGAGVAFLDINGDGLPDRVMLKFDGNGNENYFVVELSKGPIPDLLTVVSNGIGGSLTVAYKPSTRYDNRESTNSLNARKLLPFPIYTVSSVSVSDGFYPSNTTSYGYEGGMWSSPRREFHGFAHVKQTDPLGTMTGYWFHQAGGRDNSALGAYQDSINSIGKKGMPFRVETFGTNGQPYKLVLNKVEENIETNGHRFPYVSQTIALDYPGSSAAYRATAQQFQYDVTTGNLTNIANYGEVTNINAASHSFNNVDSDEVYQFTTFTTLSNTNILDKPQRTITTADSGGQTLLRETLYDYDGATGNLLVQRDRICQDNYRTKGYHYDGYGNRDYVTNEAGILTQIFYETAYNAYPQQQVTAGSFTTATQYDPLSGALLSMTDPKGLLSSNIYDSFSRLTTNLVSTTANGPANVWLTRYQYGLGGVASGLSGNSVRIQKADGVDAANGHETWTYLDGLGRAIQQRIESETNGSFRVTDTVYDQRGNIRLETQPYFSGNASYTTLDNSTKLSTRRAYDPIARPAKTTPCVNAAFSGGLLQTLTATGGDNPGSPVGTNTVAYNDGSNPWAIVRTDEENKVRKFYLDAFGRTNQIVEVNGAETYTTTLAWDKTGLLTKITDQAQNVIEYAYNDVGQLVDMADPDMGVWEYRRDFAGRLREQVDAKTNLVRFNYDDSLGRLTSRQVFNPQGELVYAIANTYDSSDDGGFTVYTGQLYKTTDSEGWLKNSYDLRGRILKTARYLAKNGQVYTTSFAYDDADRVTRISYPTNGPTVTNIYNAGFSLSQVQQVGGSNTTYYTARGFDAMGQLLGVNFANNVTTTNDYFPNSKRLRKIGTYKAGSTNIQSLSYTYDRVSNLKSIGDGVYSTNASAAITNLVFDDLHRLTSITRPAVGQTATLSYNAIGNMTANGEFVAGTYNYGVRMPHAVKSVSANNYAYDASGNMIVRGSRQRLEYNEENRLARAVTFVSTNFPRYTTNTFGYDANGARLWKQGTNALQLWIGDYYEERNGQRLYHIQADGRRICTFDGVSTNITEYYHSDHLHSSSVLTDGSGNRIQHHEYSAFGRDRFTESGTAFPVSRRYTGQILDEDTGLYFYGARYYDPDLGRFIQPDVVIPDLSNPQSYNRYSYTLNNPLKYVDPNAHQPVIARPPRQMDLPLETPPPRLYPRGTLPDHLRMEMVENLMRSPNRPTSIAASGSRLVEPMQMEFALQPPQARAVEIRVPMPATQAMPSGSSRNALPQITADTTTQPAQLEFPFARGALVQTPGETIAGETFVRVGAMPKNLKFGSTSLSGTQPDTYAFPASTFEAIGRNPAALKNLGDLPGALPQYFRTLQPPPGTPIQRGVVPGGQNGGVGGVEEVRFPKGF